MLCTARANTTIDIYRTELCSIVGLNESVPHTLVITHNDTMGRWLSFDSLKYATSVPNCLMPFHALTAGPSASMPHIFLQEKREFLIPCE